MTTLYYDDIESTVASGDYGGMAVLSGHAAALLLALLASTVGQRWLWRKTIGDEVTEITNAQWDDIDSWFGAASAALEGNMIGTIIAYASTIPPSGVLVCDGTQYAKSDYPALYAALDPVYIVDANNFVVPDLRDKFILGESTSTVVGDTGGESEHDLAQSEVPAHTHGYFRGQFSLVPAGLETAVSVATGESAVATGTGAGLTGDPHNNMPPYHVLRYGIIA